MIMILLNEQNMREYLYYFKNANKEHMIFQLNPKGNVYFCVYLFCSFYAITIYVYETSESLDKLGSTACFMFLKYHA